MGEVFEAFNGKAIWMAATVTNAELELYTEASGAHSSGAYFQGQWCERLHDRRLCLCCNNLGVVQAFKQQTANSPLVAAPIDVELNVAECAFCVVAYSGCS